MRIPFFMQAQTGFLIIMSTLAVVGLSQLNLPPLAAFGCGAAIGSFCMSWFVGLYFKFWVRPADGR